MKRLKMAGNLASLASLRIYIIAPIQGKSRQNPAKNLQFHQIMYRVRGKASTQEWNWIHAVSVCHIYKKTKKRSSSKMALVLCIREREPHRTMPKRCRCFQNRGKICQADVWFQTQYQVGCNRLCSFWTLVKWVSRRKQKFRQWSMT